MGLEKTLLSEFPELAEEFHPNKNDPLTPNSIAPQSNKKIWWIGKCGHEWQATVTNRTHRKSGCPFCAGKKPIVGQTDLATVFPSISSEWDYAKNEPISPHDVTPFCGKKVWWRCINGHSWETSISSRTSHNYGCPYCAGRRAIIGETDFATTMPSLLPEWNYKKNKEQFDLTPESVTAKSNKTVWWVCSRGHEWLAPIYRRTNGHGCPYCSRHLQKSYPETAVFYYISSVYPDAVQTYKSDFLGKYELDVFIPSINTAIEYDGSAYHNRSFSANREEKKYSITSQHSISLIRIREEGLQECKADKEVLSHLNQLSFNSLAYNEELIRIINQVFFLLGEKVIIDLLSLEKNRIEIQSLLYSTAKDTYSIPQNLLDEWDYDRNGELRPKMFSLGSNQIVYWRCKKGHTWSASIKERVGSKSHKGTRCPYCSGNEVLKGFNDFASQHPELLSEWDSEKNTTLLNLSPMEVTSKSNKEVWWKCNKGHSWKAPISRRVSEHGCPYCTNRIILEGYNDLATTNPELIKQWDYSRNNEAGLFPNKVTRGSHKKAYWQCSLGHSWIATIKERAAENNGIKRGCPICTNRIVLKGFNDFESQHPELLKSWDYEKNTNIAPCDVLSGSHKKVWWRCPYCNHSWQTQINVRAMGHGCPKCKKQ